MSKPRSAYTSNARRDGLTPGQERAIQAMLTARSIAAAARQADVGQSTLRRWLREDDNFQEKLRQLREEALSHAALMLQQGAATAVCIMHDLIQSGKPIDPGRVSLIRTAIEFAFRAAIYCDILDRVKALEKAQRQNQPAGGNPRPAPAPTQTGAARVSKRLPLVRDQPVWKQSTSQSLQTRKVNFPRPARTCPNPAVSVRAQNASDGPKPPPPAESSGAHSSAIGFCPVFVGRRHFQGSFLGSVGLLAASLTTRRAELRERRIDARRGPI